MAIFNSIYKSFDEFYNTILRGNEIEFKYKEKKYFLLPYFNGEKVVGISFGEFGSEDELICLSKEQLYNLKINDALFHEILSVIDISWNNF